MSGVPENGVTGYDLVRGRGDSGIPRTAWVRGGRGTREPGSGPRGESWGAGRLGVARVRGRREAEGGRGPSEGVEERQGGTWGSS